MLLEDISQLETIHAAKETSVFVLRISFDGLRKRNICKSEKFRLVVAGGKNMDTCGFWNNQ